MSVTRYIAVGKDEKSLNWLTEHLPVSCVHVTTPAVLLAQMELAGEALFIADGTVSDALVEMLVRCLHVVWLGAPKKNPSKAVALSKPIQLSELIRIIGSYSGPDEQTIHLSDGYEFLPQKRALRSKKGQVALTEREADLLIYLSKERGKTVSREELFRNIWGFQAELDTHTLETHIYRLRGKLQDAGENPALIETAEGGYRLA